MHLLLKEPDDNEYHGDGVQEGDYASNECLMASSADEQEVRPHDSQCQGLLECITVYQYDDHHGYHANDLHTKHKVVLLDDLFPGDGFIIQRRLVCDVEFVYLELRALLFDC